MLFFRIYHLSAKKYIGIWKIALCTQSLRLSQLLESEGVILHFRSAFYGKNKGKDGVFCWALKSTMFPLFFIMSYCFVVRIFAELTGLRP